jgi:hypothetical protein
MTRRKKTAVPPFDADGPHPMRGGAFVRLPDGSLARDTSEDQHIPDDEDSAEPERGAEAEFVEPQAATETPPATDEGA